jgi:CheY-like chemotaxis protein
MGSVAKIMLIDDDDISNFITERKLRNSGVADKIVVYNSGGIALKQLGDDLTAGEPWPEIILLDIRMPVMDGFGFLDEFILFPLEHTEKVKIAMLTSSLEKEEVKRSYLYKNVVDFINKPISEDKIRALLEKNL